MNASETKFQPIIEGTKQYIVPLFQRAYSWEKKNWSVLWDDLIWLCENSEPKSHFIGSIVTMPTVTVPEGISKFLLIDGQQRLTTLFILLSTIRDKAKLDGLEQLAQEIQQTMMVNPFKTGLDHYKLLPTQSDRLQFEALVLNRDLDEQSKIVECYKFLERKLRGSSVDLNILASVITNRLSVVSIVLDFDDNPHLVFESLNAKGLPLTQSDLIRNYFFMRIHVNEQDEIYRQFWKPMQETLGDNLTEYIRHFLMRNGAFVKQSDVYYTLKDRIGQTDALEFLKEIHRFSNYYEKILFPENEQNDKIKQHLQRIKRLEVTTAYPFLLNCYNEYAQERLSADGFIKIFMYLENYLIRRFVCNYPSNQLNKIFPALYDQAQLKSPSDLVEGVRLTLQQRDYPKDLEFRSRLIESKLYGAGDRRVKTKLLLDSLESSFEHKEQTVLDTLTIEHIMPQTLTESWQNELGEDWQATHELWLHTLGNLTLTGYNSELSNADFTRKKNLLNESHLELNRYFNDITVWNQFEIERRSSVLADKALGIWNYFGDSQNAVDSVNANDEVTGKVPRVVSILGQTNAVASWRDVLESTMNAIATVEPEAFTILVNDYPRFISADGIGLRSSRKLQNDYFIEVNLSAKSIHRFCVQAIESIGLTKDDWVVETNN
jgi:uncharacterized protein with ParB-like and HNH nuclease domain